ncbi:MAG TPA: PilN domain-containing protein [Thermoleophilaceae bacterium]|jgi:Tfp pilus assembly protein PilN
MRPVNLLPSEYRAKATTGDGRSGYIALGVLGVLLLMLIGFVMTGNSVNSKKTKIAEVNKEIARDKAEAGAQSSFGDFHKIEQTRISSVTTLASDRFDWERLVRELSLVLPNGTSLTQLDASKGPQSSDASSTSTSSTPPPSDASASGLPSMHLAGCAKGQDTVATMLVRLRQMHGVDDVNLNESTQQVEDGGDSGGAPAQGDSASGSSSDGCKDGAYKFDLTVTFKQEVAPQTGERHVPARLGGGS